MTEAVGACKLSLIQRKVLELRKIISAFLPKNNNLSELYQGALPELYDTSLRMKIYLNYIKALYLNYINVR